MPKRGLSVEQLREMARSVAENTLNELRAQIVAIERTFPELAQGRKRVQGAVKRGRKRTRKMSAAAKKAISRRMKKYWVERRRAKAKGK
jgi:hypothetical protein